MIRFNKTFNKKKSRNNKGFSLVELIIVIAIMAVLLVVCVPTYIKHVHKARVAKDWANLKSYYTEIQIDYTSTGIYNPNVPDIHTDGNYYRREINYLDGSKAELKAGYYLITKESSGNGYQIIYYCDNHGEDCSLSLGVR